MLRLSYLCRGGLDHSLPAITLHCSSPVQAHRLDRTPILVDPDHLHADA